MQKTFASLRQPGFGLFVIHSAFVAIDMNVRIAVHGWLVLELSNDSEVWLGIYALTLGIGQLTCSILTGALVDRFPRKTLLQIECTASAVVASFLTISIFFNLVTLWMALAVGFIMGCLRSIRFTGANRFIYDLVGPKQIVNGVALWRTASAPMMVLGSLVAGGLLQWLGLWVAYGFISIGLFIALPFLAMVQYVEKPDKPTVNFLQQMLEGGRYLAKDQPLRTLFLMSMVMEGLGFSFIAMIPVMAKIVLEEGGFGLGLLQAGIGAGFLIANLGMAAVGDYHNKPRLVFLNALIGGVALIGFSFSRYLPLSILLAMITMGFIGAYDLTLGALIQLISPAKIRGRAISFHSLAISFVWLGGFVMGTAGSIVGVPTMIAAGGTGVVVNAILRRPAIMRIRERQETNI